MEVGRCQTRFDHIRWPPIKSRVWVRQSCQELLREEEALREEALREEAQEKALLSGSKP